MQPRRAVGAKRGARAVTGDAAFDRQLLICIELLPWPAVESSGREGEWCEEVSGLG